MLHLRTLIGASLALTLSSSALAQSWPTHAQIGQRMQAVAANHPDIAEFHLIGLSELGREMWALHITDNPQIEEDEPEFRYISTMHGDETVGVEMCLRLCELLTDQYGSDPDITSLVDNVDIWIMPLMNPDGYVAVTRGNANGVNLNRDFPDPFTSPNNTPTGRAAETAVVMNWTFTQSITLSANLHGGALVVNYPFDNNPSGSSVYTASPDDDLFIEISLAYSSLNLPMYNGAWSQGITNGAAWYSISGGMQDWMYRYMGGNEVTIELSNTKRPSYSLMDSFWNDNRDAMLAYMSQCLIGIRGLVTDASTGDPLAATVRVVGREHNVFTDPDVGDYHRMLLPGTYTLEFEADGYVPQQISGIVVNSGAATRVDVALEALPAPAQVTYPTTGAELPADVATAIEWVGGNATTPFEVQATYNFGDIALTEDGFERTSLGADYETGGDANWLTTTSAAYAGARSAAGGNIGDNDVTWMERTVGPGQLAFYYRVSSEANYDYFRFYINGSQEFQASGNGAWTLYDTMLTGASNTLRWEFDKDFSVSDYDDTVYIDLLVVEDDNTQWVDVAVPTGPGALSAAWTPTTLTDAANVRVRTVYGGGFYSAWDLVVDGFAIVDGPACIADLTGDGFVDAGDLNIVLSNWGCEGAGCDPGVDLTGDGVVDSADLNLVLSDWGCGS